MVRPFGRKGNRRESRKSRGNPFWGGLHGIAAGDALGAPLPALWHRGRTDIGICKRSFMTLACPLYSPVLCKPGFINRRYAKLFFSPHKTNPARIVALRNSR